MQSIFPSAIGPPPVSPPSLTGRTAIVLGGASGIGFQVSRALAAASCTVHIVSRSESHGHAAVSAIKNETPKADVEWTGCDAGDLKQVRDVFTALGERLERLNFLVLCAGVNAGQYRTDADGIEEVFGVNYLAQYYATNLLWPLLRKTSLLPGVLPPRVVAVSSELHRAAPADVQFASLDEINNDTIDPARLYARSKLAQILFVKYGLVEKVIKPTSDAIFALAVHPGTASALIASRIQYSLILAQVTTGMEEQWKTAYPGVTGQLLAWAVKAVGRDPEQGSYGVLWALTAPEVENESAAYFVDPGKRGDESEQACDGGLGRGLWELSGRLVREKVGEDALVGWK